VTIQKNRRDLTDDGVRSKNDGDATKEREKKEGTTDRRQRSSAA
jgi:hypothetical protein